MQAVDQAARRCAVVAYRAPGAPAFGPRLAVAGSSSDSPLEESGFEPLVPPREVTEIATENPFKIGAVFVGRPWCGKPRESINVWIGSRTHGSPLGRAGGRLIIPQPTTDGAARCPPTSFLGVPARPPSVDRYEKSVSELLTEWFRDMALPVCVLGQHYFADPNHALLAIARGEFILCVKPDHILPAWRRMR